MEDWKAVETKAIKAAKFLLGIKDPQDDARISFAVNFDGYGYEIEICVGPSYKDNLAVYLTKGKYDRALSLKLKMFILEQLSF